MATSIPVIDVFNAAPERFGARAAWVLTTLLAPLGRRVRVTRDVADLPGCALAYAAQPQPGVPTIVCAPAAMELLASERALPAASFRPRAAGAAHIVGAFAAGDADFLAPFDILASAFVLLACWDERTSGERDRFGRLPYDASVFAANPELHIDEPAVDGYVDLLRAALAPRLAALGQQPLPAAGWLWRSRAGARQRAAHAGAGSAASAGGFAVALTHDIDNLWRWTPRGFVASAYRSARAARHGNSAALRRELGDLGEWATKHLPRRTDPFWTFPQMLAGEDARGVSSTFFVIASHSHKQDGNQPETYQRRIPAALAALRAAKREIGLHGNDADRLGPANIERDRDDLARRAAAPVDGMRYHYLRCLYHETLAYLEQAGIAYDSSLAFAEHEGFRCGTSFPFHPFNLKAERPLRLLELPLAVMDTSLQGTQYRALDAAAGERAASEILARARAAGGTVALLWHNLRFDRRLSAGYDEVYWRLVDRALAEGAFVASAGEIVRHWREHAEGVATASADTTGADDEGSPT